MSFEAIKTVRAYVEAQNDYASEDRDDDGVLEYAQKLISSAGRDRRPVLADRTGRR